MTGWPVVDNDLYYTGRPCKNGHDGLRRRLNRCCIECEKNKSKKYWTTEKGVALAARYKGSDARKISLKKYNTSEKSKAVKARYAGSEKQKAAGRRAAAKPKSILARRLRDRVRKVIKRGKGSRAGSAIRDLGCSLDHLKSHISAQFVDGMAWDNYGEWHIDHKKPLAAFDLTDRAQFLEAVHYTNLQPLWAIDNWRKADRMLEAA